MGNIGLNVIGTVQIEELTVFVTVVETLARRDGNADPLLDFARRQIEILSGMVALESGEQQSEQFVAVRALHVAENVVRRQEIVEMSQGLGHEQIPPGRLALQSVDCFGQG